VARGTKSGSSSAERGWSNSEVTLAFVSPPILRNACMTRDRTCTCTTRGTALQFPRASLSPVLSPENRSLRPRRGFAQSRKSTLARSRPSAAVINGADSLPSSWEKIDKDTASIRGSLSCWLMRGQREAGYRNWIFVHSVMILSSLAPHYLITRRTSAFLLSLLFLISRRTSSLTRLHSFPYLALTDGSFSSPPISRKVRERAIKARGYPAK